MNFQLIDKIYLVTNPLPFEIESSIIETTRVNSSNGSKDWLLRSKVYLRLNYDSNTLAKFKFYLNGIEIKSRNRNAIRVTGQTGGLFSSEFEFEPLTDILPWYPNRMDYLQENKQELKPNLYNFTVWIEKRNGSKLIVERSFKIGFKEIKLKEEALGEGKSFYFEINGLPMYAKGINYIPTTLNVGNLTEQKAKFTYLLNQVKDTNMNMIRIWGGGMYELDDFYELADELGILIWQDFMYACALYEADAKHLRLAEEEVNYQVRRLQYHPSIAIFSANNEIEGVCIAFN